MSPFLNLLTFNMIPAIGMAAQLLGKAAKKQIQNVKEKGFANTKIGGAVVSSLRRESKALKDGFAQKQGYSVEPSKVEKGRMKGNAHIDNEPKTGTPEKGSQGKVNVMQWLKNNWYYPAGVLAAIVSYFVFKPKKTKRRR